MSKKSKKSKKKAVNFETLKQLNLNAAGIDIGSAEIWVSIPSDRDDEPVRCFESFTPCLHELASWLVEDGDLVVKNQEVGEIESEKATLPLIAGQAGQLKILVPAGETATVGHVVATIDTSVEVPDIPAEAVGTPEKETAPTPAAESATASATAKTGPAKTTSDYDAVKTTPVAREMMEKEGLSVEDIINGLKKITAADVRKVMQNGAPAAAGSSAAAVTS